MDVVRNLSKNAPALGILLSPQPVNPFQKSLPWRSKVANTSYIGPPEIYKYELHWALKSINSTYYMGYLDPSALNPETLNNTDSGP